MMTTTPATTNTAAGGLQPLARLAARLRALVETRSCEPIGLEIAKEKIHLVQFESTAPQPVIRAAISLPYPDGRDALLANPDRLKALVARALATRPFRGRQVVSCLPPADVNIMMLSYQRAAGEDDAAAIVRELRERFKTEVDRSVIDYVAIRSDSADTPERSAIVAMASRERVLGYLAALRHAGLEPVALDIGPAALARLVSALDTAGRYPNALLVNFGNSRSYLSVIWGRRVMLDREFRFGEALLASRLARRLDMPEDAARRLLHEQGFGGGEAANTVAGTICEVLRQEFEVFTGEVNQTLIYTASKTRGQSVERVYLLGSVARYPGVGELVQRLVALPTEVINVFNVFQARVDAATAGELEPIAGIGLATGLALRGGGEHG